MAGDTVNGRRKGRRGVYREIYAHYTELIDSGQLGPGDRIPSSSRLSTERDISHATAAKVLQLLRDNGYVTTTSKGTFVSRTKIGRLLYQLSDALNALEDERQSLQLETGEHGSCIMGREGGVCWNALTMRWEPVDV